MWTFQELLHHNRENPRLNLTWSVFMVGYNSYVEEMIWEQVLQEMWKCSYTYCIMIVWTPGLVVVNNCVNVCWSNIIRKSTTLLSYSLTVRGYIPINESLSCTCIRSWRAAVVSSAVSYYVDIHQTWTPTQLIVPVLSLSKILFPNYWSNGWFHEQIRRYSQKK